MNSLYPFARKLAETMCRVEFPPVSRPYDIMPRPSADHGWTQKEQQAILDRPHVREPWDYRRF